jgi:alpha-glucuronidase
MLCCAGKIKGNSKYDFLNLEMKTIAEEYLVISGRKSFRLLYGVMRLIKRMKTRVNTTLISLARNEELKIVLP